MADKIKVLQVCRLTPLWGMDLFKEISKSYDNVTTVFLTGKAQPDLKNHYQGEMLCWDLNKRSILWRLKAFFKLLALCKKNKYNLIICHHYKPTLIMHFVSLFYPIKKLYSMHHNFGNFKRKNQQFMLKWLKKSWQFITVSNALKKELINLGVPDANIITIHNAIDPQNLDQYPKHLAREKLGLPQDAFIFGTLGRLVPDKGHRVLINAFKNMTNSYLVIIGSGPLEKSLREYIKQLGLENRVFINTTIVQEGANYLKAFDIFVFPSQQEAFGLVLLEAQYANLPIIASDIGGIPEAAPFAVLIPPNDIEAFETAMKKARIYLPTSHQYSFTLENYHHAFKNL